METLYEEKYHSKRLHPKVFTLWLLSVSIVMLFAAFTSALIVRKAEGTWLKFDLPQAFLFSTVVILVSSIFIFIAYRSSKKGQLQKSILFLGITFLLGGIFSYLQFSGWRSMTENGLFFSATGDKISASFVYVISGTHLLHLIGGMLYLLFTFLKAIFRNSFSTSSINLSVKLIHTYWHFIGVLWVYLYLFLLYSGK